MATDSTLRAIYLGGLFIASVCRAVYTRGSRQDRSLGQRLSFVDALIFTLGGAAFLLPVIRATTPLLNFADYALPEWAGLLGTALYIPTLWLLWRSYADLGENWHPTVRIREGHALVTSGVYSRVRHPLYAAHALWGVVQMLLVQNWIAGPGMLLTMVVAIAWRIPTEEAQMVEHFGDQYRAYMSRTSRLFPGKRPPGR